MFITSSSSCDGMIMASILALIRCKAFTYLNLHFIDQRQKDTKELRKSKDPAHEHRGRRRWDWDLNPRLWTTPSIAGAGLPQCWVDGQRTDSWGQRELSLCC